MNAGSVGNGTRSQLGSGGTFAAAPRK